MSYQDQSWNSERNSFGEPRHFPERQTLNGQHENLRQQNQRPPQMGPPPREQFHNFAPMSEAPYNNVESHGRMQQQLQYQNPPPTQHHMPPLRPQPPPQHHMPPPRPQPTPQHHMPPPRPQPPPQHQMPSLWSEPPQLALQQQRPPSSFPPHNQMPPLWSPSSSFPPQHRMPPPRPAPPSFPPHQMLPPSHSQLRPPPVTPSNFPPYQNFPMPPASHIMPGAGPILPSQQAIGSGAFSGLETNSQPSPNPMHNSFQQMPSYQPFPPVSTHGAPPDNFQHPMTIASQHKGISNPQFYVGSNKSEADDKDLGSQKLENWLQKIGKFKKHQFKSSSSKQTSSEQIWKPVNQFRAMTQLITTMSTKLQELQDGAASASAAEWKDLTLELETLKRQYIDLESLLDESLIEKVAKKLLRQRNKRARIKRAKERKYEELQRVREAWDQRSQQIDLWQERHRAKIKEETLRKSRKAAADRTLSKVTREIQDASRLIETMLALQKLRLIRRDAAEKRGDTELGESRQTFEQKIADMTRLVQAQLECYREEEAKLK
ncbi:unnamed protein product, partial [Candidula unifasciata]